MNVYLVSVHSWELISQHLCSIYKPHNDFHMYLFPLFHVDLVTLFQSWFSYIVCVLSPFSCVWLFEILLTSACQALCPWNSPGKNIGVGSHFLLQGIFPTQGSNLGRLHCRQILYHLIHWGIPPMKPNICKTCFFFPYKSIHEGVWLS